jgi:hypothetical protein
MHCDCGTYLHAVKYSLTYSHDPVSGSKLFPSCLSISSSVYDTSERDNRGVARAGAGGPGPPWQNFGPPPGKILGGP